MIIFLKEIHFNLKGEDFFLKLFTIFNIYLYNLLCYKGPYLLNKHFFKINSLKKFYKKINFKLIHSLNLISILVT